MGAIKDFRSTVVLEWETGTRASTKIHSVKLEIPPNQISLKFSKVTSKTVTTKGWVVNHGLPNLVVVTASGQAYRHQSNSFSVREGFNTNLGMSGLELLNSAFVASGKVSSNPELTTTISSNLIKQLSNQTTQQTSVDTYIDTVSNRVSLLNQIKDKTLLVGTLQDDNTIEFGDSEESTITQSNINSLKNTLTADIYTANLDTSQQVSQVTQLINSLTVSNANFIFRNFQELLLQIPKLENLVNKFDYLLNLYSNQNQGLSINGLDPSISTYIKRDPFAYIKAIAGTSILNKLTQKKLSVIDLIKQQQERQSDDWVITVYMYWQDMVFSGHFESFDMSQQAQTLNLWNWNFVYTVQDAWLLKNNSIIPFTKAFDPNITQADSPGFRPDEYRNKSNPLETILGKL